MRQRVAGDGPRTDQNNDGKGVKRDGSTAGGKLSRLPWWLPFCCLRPLVVGLCVWVPVLRLFGPSRCWVPGGGLGCPGLFALWLAADPCPPGSGFCAGFREKGQRPKNRSRRYFARAGLFQVFPGMLAVLVRRYRGRILTLVHMVGLFSLLISSSIYEKRLHALSNYRRGPVEENPRAERALRGGSKFHFPSVLFCSSSSASQFLVFLLS